VAQTPSKGLAAPGVVWAEVVEVGPDEEEADGDETEADAADPVGLNDGCRVGEGAVPVHATTRAAKTTPSRIRCATHSPSTCAFAGVVEIRSAGSPRSLHYMPAEAYAGDESKGTPARPM
jgi:hypothetical protein